MRFFDVHDAEPNAAPTDSGENLLAGQLPDIRVDMRGLLAGAAHMMYMQILARVRLDEPCERGVAEKVRRVERVPKSQDRVLRICRTQGLRYRDRADSRPLLHRDHTKPRLRRVQ